jgi:hypothetical protein
MSKGGDSGPAIPEDPHAGWEYNAPNMAAQAPVFQGYGYEAPMMQMVPAASQLPQMSVDPNAIMDPSVLAALEILNRPMMVAQMPQMLGSGTQYQEAYGLLPDVVRPEKEQKPKQMDQGEMLMRGLLSSRLFGGDRSA